MREAIKKAARHLEKAKPAHVIATGIGIAAANCALAGLTVTTSVVAIVLVTLAATWHCRL